MEAQSASRPTAPPVLRNATLLVVAQALVTPISILINAVAARSLGAASYGLYYQALTFSSFIFLFVEWGQASVLPAKVATDRAAAGELLGSGILFRVSAALVASLVVPMLCALAGYNRDFILVLALMMLWASFATVSAACQDAIRGFERTDFAAASYVGWQLLSAAVVVPVLLRGGGIHGLLIAQAVCAAACAVFVLKMLPRLHVPRLSVRRSTVLELARSGRTFVLFGLVLMLQPMVDAAMLSKFATPDAMGWYAVARKLVGVLTFPASALVVSLYPSLCRLRMQDTESYANTAANALYVVALAVMPIALGCALFPGLGVAIFGLRSYAPAEDDLRILASFILLVYFSMPIGSCLVSSGRQTAWTAVQFGCVVVSAVLDPPLITWFQLHYANGGLGVCIATVASEILMVAAGAWMLPAGILGRLPLKKLGSALLSGAVMAVAAVSLPAVDEVLRAILATLAYFVCLQLTGGVNLLEIRSVLGLVRRR